MSILVTGFEPFGGSSRNASWEAVSLLPETIAGHAVYRMRLPVCYGQAGDLLVEMMRRIRPAVTLCCGVAGGRKAITPEHLRALCFQLIDQGAHNINFVTTMRMCCTPAKRLTRSVPMRT